jgi:hypothetical protein
MNTVGFMAGFKTGRERAHARRALIIELLVIGLAATAALVERRAELFGATHRALTDLVFGLILPLALLASSGRVLLPLRLEASATMLARFGASRKSVALGLIAVSMGSAAVLAAATGVVTVLVAHDPSAPPRAVDALTTGWIGLLTGAAYAGLFALGATFGAKGGGRYWALALDLVLGGAGGFASVIVPRAHAMNLLGGAPPLMLSQPASAAALVALAVTTTALALVRLRP